MKIMKNLTNILVFLTVKYLGYLQGKLLNLCNSDSKIGLAHPKISIHNYQFPPMRNS